jgi:hypothetical protein
MVTLELRGGPLDGTKLSVSDPSGNILVVRTSVDQPMYRLAICKCCAEKEEVLPYDFIGYEAILKKTMPPATRRSSTIAHIRH